MTSDILARKNADKNRQRILLPSSQRESATVYQRSLTVQFSCPRATRLSPFVHDLPSQKLPPNGGITQQLSPLRPFPCAHSAVRRGVLTQIPFRLLPDLLHTKDLYDQHSHTVSPDHIYLSVANECCCCGLCILQSVSTRSGYFVNHIQFTTPASARLCSASLCGISDGIFDGVKLPHVLSIGRKHILCTACFLCAREECT